MAISNSRSQLYDHMGVIIITDIFMMFNVMTDITYMGLDYQHIILIFQPHIVVCFIIVIVKLDVLVKF